MGDVDYSHTELDWFQLWMEHIFLSELIYNMDNKMPQMSLDL